MQQRAMFRNMTNKEKINAEGTTHFGFRDVNEDEKQSLVKGVFDSVADKYDIMNDVMSGGLHRLWKNDLIRDLRPKPGMHLLDVAGGTGDIAFRFLKAANARMKEGDVPAKVTICDINSNMLAAGRARALDQGNFDYIDWVTGNAEMLPLPDCSVDAYTIAFGIRNVTHIDIALKEAFRVLRPGGRFMCLEFSKVDLPLLKQIYDAYSFNLIPYFGEIITGDKESYQYLVESIRKFPSQEKFKTMIKDAGFKKTTYRNLSGGIVAIHSGWRI
ncbi:MAG: bifunctional demethylmenaquinone methyltransferase/2-methoxy-6-polyprenyl-1,4-benzoquinol methylase UbiE [Emcibacteraceae bacterium]